MLDKFSQGRTLRFSNCNIEQNYREECSKLQAKSSMLTVIAISCFFLMTQKDLYWYHFFCLFLPAIPSGYLRILIFECCCTLFIIANYENGSLLELAFLFLPSFLTQFYFIKRWEVFFLLACTKAMLVPCEKKTIDLMIVILIYTILATILEKNLRDTWKTIKKHKESNHNYKELWTKIPFPVFIVNQRLSIVFQNKSFLEIFGKMCKFENIFKDDNFNLVTGLIKKVFQGSDYEETLIKEKNEEWLLIIRIVEWKYERCIEISIIEILETAYSERTFIKQNLVQDQNLSELNELIVECFQNKDKVSSEIFAKFYLFCVNIWSYQVFLEQQAEYSISNDVKCIDLQLEVINTIEIFNVKNTDKVINYRFSCNPGKFSVMVNEIRLKLFLYVLIDYTKSTANNGSLVDISLQSLDPRNSTVTYILSAKLTFNEVTESELLKIFKHCRKDLEDLEDFNKHYSMAYALFHSNCLSLGIEIKEACVIQDTINLTFILKLKTSLLKPVSVPLNVSEKFSPVPCKLIWQSLIQYKKIISSSFTTQTLPSLSVFPQLTTKFPSISKTLKKSKNNPFPDPIYYCHSLTPKRFYYKCTNSKINFETDTFKVLIVDDIKQNRIILSQYLKKIMPISHDEASDGLIALEMYKDYASIGFKYQIIFMDLIMPKMTGYEASIRIRQHERSENFPATYICAVTGNLDNSEKCSNSEINEIGNK